MSFNQFTTPGSTISGKNVSLTKTPELITPNKKTLTPKLLSDKSVDMNIIYNKKFISFLIFNLLMTTAKFIPNIFMTQYGLRWFAGCNPISKNLCIGVRLVYSELNLYSSLSSLLQGLISFIFGGYIGRLSDTYGRKAFLLLHPILFLISISPLLISNDYLWYLCLLPITGFTGMTFGLSPIMTAYISDILPVNQKTIGFSLAYGVAAFGLYVFMLYYVNIKYIVVWE